ncbi:hypothetical protein Hokovirus_1_153 [Hokovirus HKV1]|uniref:Uncharacterized protein n=1 Tax=Hokovirus HKV1 TaxID=1977638 RepID=A0A1V0SF59_9VIRU|nr:hypothetical protein Hokovirus_1_153 [Hokovirus HKV1]
MNYNNDLKNPFIRTIIMGIVKENVSKLNYIPNLQYHSIIDEEYNYGIIFNMSASINFKIYAKVNSVIYNNHDNNTISNLMLSEPKIFDNYNPHYLSVSDNFDNYPDFDASWKITIHSNNEPKNTFINKMIKKTMNNNYNYYAKNIKTMVKYVAIILECILGLYQENSEFNETNINNIIINGILLQIKFNLEKENYTVIVLNNNPIFELNVNNDINISYKQSNDKVCINCIQSTYALIVDVNNIVKYISMYFDKKNILGNGIEHNVEPII